MLPFAKGTNSDGSDGGDDGGSGVGSPRKPAIFTVAIDDAGHVSSTSNGLNKITQTSINTADSNSFSADHNEKVIVFSDAAEKCATIVLSAIFESMSLKSDNIHSPITVVPKPDSVMASKELLKGAKSDAYLSSNTSDHYAHSLSKSDLMELKRSIVKSDFKPVQDPLSASKLRKNCSVDCHPWHSPIFEISSLDSSRYVCESVVDCDEIDGSRPFVLFPSIRYASFSMHLLFKF